MPNGKKVAPVATPKVVPQTASPKGTAPPGSSPPKPAGPTMAAAHSLSGIATTGTTTPGPGPAPAPSWADRLKGTPKTAQPTGTDKGAAPPAPAPAVTDNNGTAIPAKEFSALPKGVQLGIKEVIDNLSSGAPMGWKAGSARKWGVSHENRDGDLPAAAVGYTGTYTEYYVIPKKATKRGDLTAPKGKTVTLEDEDGVTGSGSLRLVMQTGGSKLIFYTDTHYGRDGDPPFYLLKGL